MGRDMGEADRGEWGAPVLAFAARVDEAIKKRVPADAMIIAAKKNIFRRLPVTDPPTESKDADHRDFRTEAR
jgi:hypothetical protein